MVKPQDENFLQNKIEDPRTRARKARMGKGFIVFFACLAAVFFAIYIAIAVYGLSFA
jgi:hypothetical protein